MYIYMKKKQTQKKSQTQSQSSKSKVSIVDPEFSKTLHKGTQASSHCALCERSYHYQAYETYIHFIGKMKEIKKLTYVYVPEDFSDMVLELDMKHELLKPLYTSESTFKKHLQDAFKNTKITLIPIVLNLSLGKDDNHANCIVINKQTKVIELFEPHGHRDSVSTLGGDEGGYVKKIRTLKHYWKVMIGNVGAQDPDAYKVSNVVDYVDKTAFQVLNDPEDSSGYCVTWSLLYTHYRLLNPKISETDLIHYLDKKINTRMLLKYARRVEEIFKQE